MKHNRTIQSIMTRALGGLGFIIKFISVTQRHEEVRGYAVINTHTPMLIWRNILL